MVETFRGDAVAEKLFSAIVAYARSTNPFYRRWIPPSGDPPLLDRKTALKHNDEILNGAVSTGTTSGSIGVPLRYAHAPEWTQRAALDLRRFVAELGGPVPTAQILPSRPGNRDPLFISVGTPVDDQLSFILYHRGASGVTAITTLPTNAEILSQKVIDRRIDTSFVT